MPRPKRTCWRAAAAALVACAAAAPAVQAAPIALNASTAGGDAQVWRTHARIRAYVTTTPAGLLVSQLRPENWDAALASKWGMILPTRSMDKGGGCLASDFYGGRIIRAPDGGLRWRRTGEPNCALTAEYLYDSAVHRLHEFDPRYIVVDEVATGTMRTVTDFLRIMDHKANAGDRQAAELRRRLAFYVVAGDGVRPGRFPAYLRRFLTRTKAPVWGEIYGGELKDVRPKPNGVQNGRMVRARLKGTAIRIMRRNLRWNVRPMLSGAPRHVGTGRASILNLRQRIRFVKASTGMVPAAWKLNGVVPSEAGLGAMVAHELSTRPPSG